MPTLNEMMETARKLGCDLLNTDAIPCTEQKRGTESCVMAEDSRPLTKEEKGKGWARRPFNAYDHRRMCNGCAAYWFASMTANMLTDMHCWAERSKAEAEMKARDTCPRCSGNGVTERSAVAGGPFPTCITCNGSGRKGESAQ